RRDAADVRRGAEAGELGVGVVGYFEVLAVKQPHDRRSDDRADHLRGNVTRDFAEPDAPGGGHRDRHRGIQMSAAVLVDAEDSDKYRHAPAEGDDDPPTAVAFGARQHDVGDDAVAEDDQDRGADDFGEEGMHE